MQSADQYAQALTALLPPGDAWRASDQPLGDLLAGLAQELARIDARALALLEEADPGNAVALLDEWEVVLGLPDPCLTEPQTDSQRRAAARARYTLVGGQTAAFYIGLAAQLGYTMTVEDFATEADAIAAGISYTGDGWAYTWRCNVDAGTLIKSFAVGQSSVGDALRSWGVEPLECLIKRFAPAHTVVLFAYA